MLPGNGIDLSLGRRRETPLRRVRIGPRAWGARCEPEAQGIALLSLRPPDRNQHRKSSTPPTRPRRTSPITTIKTDAWSTYLRRHMNTVATSG